MAALISHVSDVEVHAVIRYLKACEWTPSEIYRELCEVYGEQQTMSAQVVRKWVQQFKEGRVNVQSLPCVGRPSTAYPAAVILLGYV